MLDPVVVGRMCALSGDAPICVALSGGGDSVALLHLLAEGVGPRRLRALVVDHALRAGSDDAARRAASFATALGVRADVLTLAWPDRPRRAQAHARRARYAALCEAARGLGARVIAAAHSADDQAETVFIRAGAGSSWRGLAGMAPLAPAPLWPEGRGLALARPLLGVRRAELRAVLHARGAEWIEDPANADAAFERVRVRAQLAELERGGFEPMRLARLAAGVRVRADALDAEAWALVERAARFEGPEVALDLSVAAPAIVRARALAALLAAAAGAERAPSLDDAAAILSRIDGAKRFTIAGVLVQPQSGGVRLARDPGAVLGHSGVPPLAELALTQARETVWDGRMAFMAAAPGWRAAPAADASGYIGLIGPGERLFVSEPLGQDGPVLFGTNAVNARWLLRERAAHALSAGLILDKKAR